MSSQESRFKLQSFNETLSFPDPEFLIEGMLVKDSFAVIFGPSGVGKTFLGLSIAFEVATKRSWFGKAVNGGPVVYVSAEGRAGLKDRSRALQQTNESSDEPPFSFVTEAVNFLDQTNILELINEIKKITHEPALIIVDTLARCFVGGNENDARDMGLFIFGIDILRRATGAAILVIHHTGKNEKSERGSSALRGAADTMIKCGGDMGLVFLQCDKQKDSEPFKDIQLKLQKVELENDRSSCVLVPFEGAGPAAQSSGTDAKDEKILGVLEKEFGADGGTATEWQRACTEKIGVPHKTFYNRLDKLKALELVVLEGDRQGARYRVGKSKPVPVPD
jgi:hypothetical protein